MFVCMYVCLYVCVHACMYGCMHACNGGDTRAIPPPIVMDPSKNNHKKRTMQKKYPSPSPMITKKEHTKNTITTRSIHAK